MKSLVTGGAGFIGSHCVDQLLDRGHKVIIVDNLVGGNLDNINHHSKNENFTFLQADINDLDVNSPVFDDLDYIFHFAGIGDIVPSIENPYDYMRTNVLGTIKILDLAVKKNVLKFVYAASSSCYGLANTPTAEDHPINPTYPYALSKFQGEQACFHWARVYGLKVNSIRIFNAYGTRSRTSGAYGAVMGVFLKQKLENKPFTVVGDGTQKRDFIYVTDVANAFIAAAETDVNGEVFNLGAGNPQSINRLVELLGGDIEFIDKREGEPDITYAKIDKIKHLLEWSPKISFENGIKIILDNIDYWEKAPLWDKESIKNATRVWFKYMSKNG